MTMECVQTCSELLGRFFLPLADLAAVNHHIVHVGDAINLRMEPKEKPSNRISTSLFAVRYATSLDEIG